MTRDVVILGSTGSIGRQALDVVRTHGERFRLVGLGAGSDAGALAAQAHEFGVRRVALADADAARDLAGQHADLDVLGGSDGVAELAAGDADVVLNAITGAAGLASTLAALDAGNAVALANKESLIVGGALVTAAADAAGGRASYLVPVDSEHSALAQCLRGGSHDEVARLVLTASGGPFRGWTLDELATVRAEEALAHPTWDMGPMITINSATLMNKGLELIEAHELFGIPWDALDVVVHPQSVVHSMVEYLDGSTLAQMSPPDMRLPIQLALGWPERLDHAFVRCDWSTATTLTFEPVDRATFRALDLAEEAGRRRGTYPAVMNAANEVAVEAFLADRVGFLDVTALVAEVLESWDSQRPAEPVSVDEVLEADAWARRRAGELLVRHDRRTVAP